MTLSIDLHGGSGQVLHVLQVCRVLCLRLCVACELKHVTSCLRPHIAGSLRPHKLVSYGLMH